MYTDEQVTNVARVCHEANRAYCLSLGDVSHQPWDNAGPMLQKSVETGVRFHFDKLSKGEEPAPSASHDAWVEYKRAEGWKYGPVKNPAAKEHPCFVPYHALPATDQFKDTLFAAIAKAFFNELIEK